MSSGTKRTWIGLGVGLALALLTLEALLWLLPTQNGIFAADPDPEWPVHHLRPNSRYSYSAGWNFRTQSNGRINNYGYTAPVDYQRGTRGILVFGDSYIESLMNPYGETLQAQLARKLGGQTPVMHFSIASSAMPDYLGIGQLTRKSFPADWIVILMGEGDFVEGFGSLPGHFQWGASPTDPILLVPDKNRGQITKAIRTVGLVRYVRGNLRLTPKGLFHSRPSTEIARCVPERLEAGDADRIRSFVDLLPAAHDVTPKQIIVLLDSETQRKTLYKSETLDRPRCPKRDQLALELFVHEATMTGIHVIDTMPLFAEHYRNTGQKVDHSPADWHWNGIAHGIAASAVANKIASCTAAPADSTPCLSTGASR